jgi:CDGSH-type Zn-finger protein
MIPIPDGPLLVRGDLRNVDPETGGVIAEETRVALCRCGKSDNQPFCDSSHRRTHLTQASHIESSARADARSPADICPPQDLALEKTGRAHPVRRGLDPPPEQHDGSALQEPQTAG